MQIAEDTIIDLPGLAFKGKKWQDVRSALNKAKRESITFRMTTLADEPFAVLAQVRAISEQWVGEKGLPEMGFTLGGVDEALDPAVKVGLAIDPTGSIHGVTSWLPVYAPGRARPGLDPGRDAPPRRRLPVRHGVHDRVGVPGASRTTARSSCRCPGRRWPAASSPARSWTARTGCWTSSAPRSSPSTASARCTRSRRSSRPRYEPIHLAFRDEADLPRIGVALTRAYLPDASPRQLLAAGLSAHGEKPGGGQ